MSLKNIIKLFFTSIYLLLSLGFFIFFQYPEMVKSHEEEAKKIISSIYYEIINGGINNKTINDLPNNFFYAVWVKDLNHDWRPVIYNKKYILKSQLIDPLKIPKKIENITKRYPKNYPFIISNHLFYIWINKFNIDYFMKYIVLAFLFLLLFYLFFIILIEILFSEKIKTQIKYDDKDDINDIDDDIVQKDQDSKENQQNNILNSYKELWNKNFKISNGFKNNFPFDKIYNLVRFSIKPEQYIGESIETAGSFFKWKFPKLYINQDNNFIDIETKKPLDITKINIPLKGDLKGHIYIPLFPYNTDTVYGYLYFEWNNTENFFIADILYFLKFLFSDRAKSIFTNYPELEKIINIINDKIEKNHDMSFALLEVDDKEKLITSMDKPLIEKLNNEIKEKLIVFFNREIIFQISPLVFGFIGVNQKKDEEINKIKNWISNKEIQLYNISNQYGSIALTYSCGISFKNNRDIHPLTLINEAENLLKIAVDNGRNQVVS